MKKTRYLTRFGKGVIGYWLLVIGGLIAINFLLITHVSANEKVEVINRPGDAANVILRDASGNYVAAGGGGGGGGAATVADGADVTQGAKADAKSTATDTTAVSQMSVLKQISASVQAPPSQAVTNAGTFVVQQSGAQLTIAMSNVTSSGSVAAGKKHIEFILSTDFAGSIGGVTVSGATLAVYSPGEAPLGSTFAALTYTISAGSATLTTW